MTISIPARLRNDEDFAACLVKRYLAGDPAGRAIYSGAYFERIGGGGDREDIADQFTAEDLLAVGMLSVRIEGYHALEILCYRESGGGGRVGSGKPKIWQSGQRRGDPSLRPHQRAEA